MKATSKKRASSLENDTRKKQKISLDLSGVRAVIVEVGLGKTRASILAKQLERHGGKHQQNLESSTTHVLIDKKLNKERLTKSLGVEAIPEEVHLVDSEWLSKCLSEGKLVDLQRYILGKDDGCKDEGKAVKKASNNETGDQNQISVASVEEGTSNTALKTAAISSNNTVTFTFSKSPTKHSTSKTQVDDDSDYIDSGDEGSKSDRSPVITPNTSPEKLGNATWVCAQACTSKQQNHNQLITDKLQVLATAYANTKDQWRALGYKKAIASVKNYHKRLETWEECSNLPFVGERLAKKIWEISQTGHLRRLDHVDPQQNALNLFVGVWGAGPTTAEAWVSQGLKTLEDLKQHGKLTRQQEIGLKYYDEFLERMPREEAGKIEEVVKEAAIEINSGLQAFACGSYRRGKPTCGDVDVIVSHPDGKSHEGVMAKLLERLKSTGLITDDLTLSDSGEHRKYLGVCKLPGEDTKHRRLEIIVVPYNEWACSLLYFTGSDYFNRSMRLLAKKNDMSLSEHSLNKDVVRKGSEKIFEGTPLPVFSEKDVFDYLGLEYREPHERDW
ncbi:DNA polymerase lambda-like [Stylophora pistillata]|uniref:DNA polymerase lambda-like n=1 Tax=Stylophora pistillata TaxID=50429 RepID=UPI000C03CE0A|nr:DNA polymerase lambda-like [Stylophora pistillata]